MQFQPYLIQPLGRNLTPQKKSNLNRKFQKLQLGDVDPCAFWSTSCFLNTFSFHFYNFEDDLVTFAAHSKSLKKSQKSRKCQTFQGKKKSKKSFLKFFLPFKQFFVGKISISVGNSNSVSVRLEVNKERCISAELSLQRFQLFLGIVVNPLAGSLGTNTAPGH